MKCAAEILAITITLENKRKIVICTCYRVGTLGMKNRSEIHDFLRKIRIKKNISNLIITGDLNLSSVNWPENMSSDKTEQSFIDTFSNFGLEQLIKP